MNEITGIDNSCVLCTLVKGSYAIMITTKFGLLCSLYIVIKWQNFWFELHESFQDKIPFSNLISHVEFLKRGILVYNEVHCGIKGKCLARGKLFWNCAYMYTLCLHQKCIPTVIYIRSSCGIEFVKSVKAFRCTLSNSNWRNLSFTGQPILSMKLFRGRTIYFHSICMYVEAQGAQHFSLRSDWITSYFLLIGDIFKIHIGFQHYAVCRCSLMHFHIT